MPVDADHEILSPAFDMDKNVPMQKQVSFISIHHSCKILDQFFLWMTISLF
jgi:hypothetical protein